MKTPRSALFLAAAVALAMAVFPAASSVTAQEEATPFGAISCSSNYGNPVLLDQKLFHLVPAPAAEIWSLQKTKPALSAGPFAAGKFPYDNVEIYSVGKDQGEDDTEESAVYLYVRAVRNQKESWFTIAHERGDPPASDFLMRTKGDSGPEAGIEKDNDPGPAVSLALKNGVPIFEVSWWRRQVGASTEAAEQKILLLDFRTLHPSVLSALECVAVEGGGVCGVWDGGSAPTTSLACDWDAAKSDFLCTSSETGDYTPPVTHRFYLASGADAPYPAQEGDPPTLNVLAAWNTYNALTNKTPDVVPGLGAVTVLGRYAPDGARETAVVLASRGSSSFEPRYFGVVVDSQGQSAAVEILPQALVDEASSTLTTDVPSAPDTRGFVIPAVINAADKFADDAAPSFQVELLESFSNVSLWQVKAKQGTFHEVVWLTAGFNSGTGRYVFSAVRIASEFVTYAACGSTRSEPFAASIERKKGTVDAILDVEPAHEYDVDGKRVDSGDQGQQTTACPVKVRMFWNTSLGFVREETDADCPATASARSMTISDAGVITTKLDDSQEQ